jgi:hypothetical protein
MSLKLVSFMRIRFASDKTRSPRKVFVGPNSGVVSGYSCLTCQAPRLRFHLLDVKVRGQPAHDPIFQSGGREDSLHQSG